MRGSGRALQREATRALEADLRGPGEAVSEARVHDHAVIGDGRSAALVDRDGSIDWLCWPRFDSPSLFASILDPARGGRFRLGPAGPRRARREYLEDTNVLVTTFETADGGLRLVDAMAVAQDSDAAAELLPEHEILRLAECVRGTVEVELELDARPGYGLLPRRLVDAGRLGIRVALPRAVATLSSTMALRIEGDGVVRGRSVLRAGEAVAVSLAYDEEAPAIVPPVAFAPERIARTAATWRSWCGPLHYDGPHAAAVKRSALALKLLAFAPSGAIVAAPTTSLPERPGGSLNWDYRFCWLRDAALTVRALYGLGCSAEAEEFAAWLLHSTRLSRPELHVLYDVYGRQPPRERELPHLAGHAGSRPVRVGNAAAGQDQLDVYGEVVDAVTQTIRRGQRVDSATQSMLLGFGEHVCRHWQEPESGIWEPREPPRLRTHSLVMAHTALTRLLELHRRGELRRGPVERFESTRHDIRDRIEEDGFDPTLGSYVATLHGSGADAALLLLPWYGYADAKGARMQGTWRRIREKLLAGPGLLYRYEASKPARESAFGICSFWAVEFLAGGGGTLSEAEAWMETVLARANDVGLFAEEIDPATGEAVGNFPQAFTHVGLISAALALEERARDERKAERGTEARA